MNIDRLLQLTQSCTGSMADEPWLDVVRRLELRGRDLNNHAVEDHKCLAESWGTIHDKLVFLPTMTKDTWESLVRKTVGFAGAAGSLAGPELVQACRKIPRHLLWAGTVCSRDSNHAHALRPLQRWVGCTWHVCAQTGRRGTAISTASAQQGCSSTTMLCWVLFVLLRSSSTASPSSSRHVGISSSQLCACCLQVPQRIAKALDKELAASRPLSACASLTPFLLLLRHLQQSKMLPLPSRPDKDLLHCVRQQVEGRALQHLPTLLSAVAQEVQETQVPSLLPESLWLPTFQLLRSQQFCTGQPRLPTLLLHAKHALEVGTLLPELWSGNMESAPVELASVLQHTASLGAALIKLCTCCVERCPGQRRQGAQCCCNQSC